MLMRDFIYCIINNSLNDDFEQKTKDEWKRFMQGKPVNTDIVPLEIYSSWKQSKLKEVDPIGKGPYLLDNTRTKELTSFRQMTRNYGEYFDRIEELVNKEFALLIFDKNGKSGRLVELLGHYPKHTIGFDCSEQTVGTSAAILALQENRPMLVLGKQHYQKQLHHINYAAAPIHNNKNEVIGVLDLAFYDLKQSAKAYFLVKYLAKAFDIFYSSITDEHEIELNQVLDLLPQGIVYINTDNAVQFYNQKLLEILSINGEQDIQKQLKKYISKIGVSHTLDKKEIQININEKPTNICVIPQPENGKLSNQANKLLIFEGNIRTDIISNSVCTQKLYTFDDIIGHNHALQEAKSIAMIVAHTSVPVLLWGENGTGKEMFAQAIHHTSNRRDQHFVAINCGAIPSDIVESELFGYEEGSFTGAMKGGKIGKIEAASGGSLFLDEIESMPLHVQIKLLRVLSTSRILKVGGTKEIPVDIRIIAATKKDLLQEADCGLFREDLYFRLSTFIIRLPALRERKEDIQLLAQYFIKKLSNKYAITNIVTDSATLNALSAHSWRGNVRELEHTIERAIILMGTEKVLTVQHLPEKIQKYDQNKNAKQLLQTVMEHKHNKIGLLAVAEEIVIDHILNTNGGNISNAAKQLGIDRKTIYNKLQKYPNLYEKYANNTKGPERCLWVK
ncbi:MAG: sigma-54 interaction domain-containing protein [Bacillota bacterium]